MKKVKTIAALLAAVTCFSLAGCAGGTSEVGDSTIATAPNVNVVTEPASTAADMLSILEGEEFTSSYDVLKSIKLGQKLKGTAYLYSVSGGVSTYYIHGRYVLTNEGVVTQTRDELEVEDVSSSIRSIIEKDTSFDLDKATVSFYASDGSVTTGSLDECLTSVITDCVVEYVDWIDDAKTYGAVQSYLFTYGYVPTKIEGYYDASLVEESESTTTTSDAEVTPEVSDTSAETAAE